MRPSSVRVPASKASTFGFLVTYRTVPIDSPFTWWMVSTLIPGSRSFSSTAPVRGRSNNPVLASLLPSLSAVFSPNCPSVVSVRRSHLPDPCDTHANAMMDCCPGTSSVCWDSSWGSDPGPADRVAVQGWQRMPRCQQPQVRRWIPRTCSCAEACTYTAHRTG